MYQVVYMSNAKREFNDDELLEMLFEFRKFNGEHDISGLLIYHRNCFMQVIEGPDAHIHRLYAKICHDTRHNLVMTLLSRPINTREFPDWSMGFVPREEFSESLAAGFTDFFGARDGADRVPEKADLGYQLLESVRGQLLRRESSAH